MAAELAGVAPSILAADFSRLGEQVGEVLAAGARVIHVDVMDGHFVPPITMGPLAVGALAERVHAAGALIDVHLMIERPEGQIAEFAKAGADNITFHAEATPHLHYAVSAIKEAGCSAGVAICPGTPVEALSELAEDLDLALCMTVNPGWGGQEFLPRSPGKIERLRALIGPGAALEVDGGVDRGTAGTCAQAGATVFVAGSAVFGAEDPAAAFRAIADAAGVRPAV
jgi:ribulose-phosphate 3-epimerase